MARSSQDSSAPNPPTEGARGLIARAFTLVEDIVYVGLGALLSIGALVALWNAGISFSNDMMQATMRVALVALLDRLLLVLMIVELLYTVQVSFREHAVVPEPFLIVGLVAATRRVLVITAEVTGGQAPNPGAFRASMIELGLLTVMIVALVASLLMLRRRHPEAVATRA
jgi:uncharacterized membrane protein (DUF373 family)